MQKTILITGSTDGIGKLVALRFAKEGHIVVLHGRSQQKLSTVLSEIKKQSKNENITGFIADFADLDSVKQMAQQVNQKLSHIDVLINNAGVFMSPIYYNKKGIDLRFVVNYFAPFLLTKELTMLLNKGTEPRIINLSSAAQTPVSYDALLGKTTLEVNDSYAQSKLALTMWSFYMAKTHPNFNVIAVNPGSLLDTKMANEAYGQFWSPAEKGSDILYELALSEEHRGISGKYFDNDNGLYTQAHPHAYIKSCIDQLIEVTNRFIN